MRGIWQDWRLALRMLCAIALVFVAFAHKPIVADADPIDLAAYTLPDGTIPVLCLPGSGDQDDHHKSSWHGTGCEACRLSVSFILPVPPFVSGAKVQPAQSLATERKAILIARSLYPPSAPPQAPPLA
ncbi:MAG: hypothetical protein AAAB35_25440 [Phyllobacterium sp.]|uniref:hypothetical protein n=1 Tax=Phyllobacterium sp. TaxID=1871046 RepID=UPI0030F2C6A7